MILSARAFGFENRSSCPPGICTNRCSPSRLVILGCQPHSPGGSAILGAEKIAPWYIQGVEPLEIQWFDDLLIGLRRQLVVGRPGEIEIGVVEACLAP